MSKLVPDTAAFTFVGRATGPVEINNTIYIRNEVIPWTASIVEDVATDVGNFWRDEVVPQFASTYTFDRVEGRDLGAEFGATALVEYNEVGGDAATPLSAMDCIYVALTGEGGSPPRRGALFLSPFTEADLTLDAWTNGTKLTALQTAMDGLDALISGLGYTWVIVSRYSKTLVVPVTNPKGERDPAVTNQVVGISVQSNLATQRDRRAGQGV